MNAFDKIKLEIEERQLTTERNELANNCLAGQVDPLVIHHSGVLSKDLEQIITDAIEWKWAMIGLLTDGHKLTVCVYRGSANPAFRGAARRVQSINDETCNKHFIFINTDGIGIEPMEQTLHTIFHEMDHVVQNILDENGARAFQVDGKWVAVRTWKGFDVLDYENSYPEVPAEYDADIQARLTVQAFCEQYFNSPSEILELKEYLFNTSESNTDKLLKLKMFEDQPIMSQTDKDLLDEFLNGL